MLVTRQTCGPRWMDLRGRHSLTGSAWGDVVIMSRPAMMRVRY